MASPGSWSTQLLVLNSGQSLKDIFLSSYHLQVTIYGLKESIWQSMVSIGKKPYLTNCILSNSSHPRPMYSLLSFCCREPKFPFYVGISTNLGVWPWWYVYGSAITTIFIVKELHMTTFWSLAEAYYYCFRCG